MFCRSTFILKSANTLNYKIIIHDTFQYKYTNKVYFSSSKLLVTFGNTLYHISKKIEVIMKIVSTS